MFFDTDCGGVVHNIAYLRFIETARTLLAEELGMKLVEMAKTQRYPVVVRTEIDYRRAASWATVCASTAGSIGWSGLGFGAALRSDG